MATKERGGALLIVLWLSAALGAIALSVSTTVRAEVEHTSTVADGLRAHYLATGSLERAVQWMLWIAAPANADGTVRFWDRNKPRMNMSYPSGDVIVELIPETSKLNINTAPEAELLKVVTALTNDPAQARAIVAGILNWRSGTPDDNPFDSRNLAQGPTFQPPHTSLKEIEELLSVPGVTPELFYGNYVSDAQGQLYARGGLRDCFSVWGTTGPVDVNGASPAVLEAVGLTPSEIGTVIQRRSAQPFRNVEELTALRIPAIRLRVGGGSMWTMRATARLKRPDGQPSETVRSAAAVVKYWDDVRGHSGSVQVIRYYNDGWSQFAATPPLVPGVIRP